jgi:hypothetical protein
MLPAGKIFVTVNTSRHPTRRNRHSYSQNKTPMAATRSPICPPDDGCQGKAGRKNPRNSEHISPPNSPEPSQLHPEHNTIGSNMQPDLLS